MFRKLINWFNKPPKYEEDKPKKKKVKKATRKINSLNEIIQEQASSINFLIEQLDIVRAKNIELARQVKELKKQLKEKEVQNGK